MTWPFENDTSAILKKMASRSIKADKRSKAFLLLTIAISVCMIFSIILISTGTQEEFKNTQRNKAQIGILGVTDEQTALLRQNENISWIGEYSALGFFYIEDKTITVAYGNEDYFLHQEEKVIQGSVPQSKDEIMLPQNYIDFLEKSYQVGDTISIDLTGTGQEAEYTLSGILNDTKKSNGYFIYVNKELAQGLAKDSFQVTAYTRLNTDAINSSAILDFASKAIQNTGIVEEQVMLTEYSAVMSGVITSGIPIPVPLLAALTAILAATIVYGVFYTKIVKNVQMFGQLRTIGMTKKQIKQMARKEGRLYALTGIPLGLVIGALIGFIGCPDGFRPETTIVYAVLIAIVAFVTVNIAMFKPVRVAMNTSPVEGAKYLAYAGNEKSSSKLHRKLTPFNLAKINIQRNKQKAIFLDRDGTINKYVGFLRNIDEFELENGVVEAIKLINKSGYLAIVVTNQPVIARGEVSIAELQTIHNKMETLLGLEGAYLDGIYFCPHHPHKGYEGERPEYKIDCQCRKPKPGMLLKAAEDFNIDLSKSWMIGDGENDVGCGKNAGCRTAAINCDFGADIKGNSLYECVSEILAEEN